ncbi:HGxxPAAW family protein [Streptomyces adustus]|uniref:HGxxPAAW family protein n=1 Tax=Streptomyces adustus TaxID=1609272 RepID=UPI00371E7F74
MSGHHDEGHTIAGWTGFTVATIGALALGMGIVSWRPGVWVGLAVLVTAVLITWVLHLAGWGKPPVPRGVDQRRLSARDHSVRDGHANCLGCRLAGRHGGRTRTTEAP